MDGSRVDALRSDAEECEAAILQVLAAMDGNDEREHADAFSRFNKIFKKTLEWAPEQKLVFSGYLAEHGRIEAGDWEAVVDALNEFTKERGD